MTPLAARKCSAALLCRETGKSKGIALVQFVNAAEAVAAHAAEDAKPFQGRLLHILPGHRPPPSRVAAEAEVHASDPLALQGVLHADRFADVVQSHCCDADPTLETDCECFHPSRSSNEPDCELSDGRRAICCDASQRPTSAVGNACMMALSKGPNACLVQTDAAQKNVCLVQTGTAWQDSRTYQRCDKCSVFFRCFPSGLDPRRHEHKQHECETPFHSPICMYVTASEDS